MAPSPRMSDQDWGEFREGLGREFASLHAELKDLKENAQQHDAKTAEIHSAIHGETGILERLRVVESKLNWRWRLWTAIGGATGFLVYGFKWLFGYLKSGGKIPSSH